MENQTEKQNISNQGAGPLLGSRDKNGVVLKSYNYTTRKKKSKRNPWLIYTLIGLGTLLLLALVTVAVVNTVLETQYTGKIEPGTSISGVYIGEMTREEAKSALTRQLANTGTKPVSLAFQDKNWQPTLEQLGVTINLDTSLDHVQITTKGAGLIEGSRIYKLLYPQAQNFPLEIQIDENKLKGYLGDISERIRKEVVEPTLEIKNAQVLTTDGAEGYNVDYDVTFDAIKRTLINLTPSSQNLLTVKTFNPVITNQEVSDFRAQILPIFSTPLIFKFKEKNWTFDQRTLASMVTIQKNADPKQLRHFTANVDTSPIEKFVTGLKKDINQEPKDAKIAWENNQVVVKEPSSSGQFLVVDKTVDTAIKQVNDPNNRTIDLLVDVRNPQIDSTKLDALGIKEVIGEGISHFAGSAPERATNITVGAKYLNGALIKPHSTFSFLDQIGEISEKRGYQKGYAILADQTVPDVGGGICQVATTTFRAAFYTGSPIIERNAHLYRVSWYEELGEPVGFDAAVYEPGVDFKFQNSTDYWMAISAFVKNGNLVVQVYGTKTPGMTVDLIKGEITNQKPPPPDKIEVDPTLPPGTKKQLDFAHAGLDTTITRVVKLNGAELKKEPFFTRLQPWPNIIKIGPTPGQNPGPPTTPR